MENSLDCYFMFSLKTFHITVHLAIAGVSDSVVVVVVVVVDDDDDVGDEQISFIVALIQSKNCKDTYHYTKESRVASAVRC